MRWKINWDAMGMGASIACAIHCAILPLLLSSLPIFGIDIIDNHGFEYFMIFLAFIIGVYALLHGYKKHHKKMTPIVIFSIGIIFLFSKELWHDYSILFLVPAVTLIVAAHYINFRMCRKIPICHDEGHAH